MDKFRTSNTPLLGLWSKIPRADQFLLDIGGLKAYNCLPQSEYCKIIIGQAPFLAEGSTLPFIVKKVCWPGQLYLN